MDYKEQLAQSEWQQKREEILKRDECKCTNCDKGRSEFRDLARFRDLDGEVYVCTIKQMTDMGYSISPKSLTPNGTTFLFKSGWVDIATYIGDNRELVMDELRFCQKFDNKNSGKKPSLYFFHQDTLEYQGRVDLNIHHKYYISGRRAWEYDNEALVTLCSDCHKIVHQEQVIYVYKSERDSKGKQEVSHIAEVCSRCGGAGILPEFHYHQQGVCFGCSGEGVVGI